MLRPTMTGTEGRSAYGCKPPGVRGARGVRAHRTALIRHGSLLLVAVGCASVLGIEEGRPRKDGTGGVAGTNGNGNGGAVAGTGPHSGNGGALDAAPGAAGGEVGGTANAGAAGALPEVAGGAAGVGPDPTLNGGSPRGTGPVSASGVGGVGGTAADCESGTRRCGGPTGLTAELCTEGVWTPNPGQGEAGECSAKCENGRCVECLQGERSCTKDVATVCENGAWREEIRCGSRCLAGACEQAPSCQNDLACGSDGDSCCTAVFIPGGVFTQREQAENTQREARVSPFWLDRYEVTVARFRRFVDAYANIAIAPGSGKHPNGTHSGWQSFDLPSTRAELTQAVAECDAATWTDEAAATDDHPINCVTFNVAYAFCIWDGGRLPSETEWHFAASGGDGQRVYPWSNPPNDDRISLDHAVYFGDSAASVGSKSPRGDALWENADMAGNVAEWTLDWFISGFEGSCDDCVLDTPTTTRVVRGGAYNYPFDELLVGVRKVAGPVSRSDTIGLRCAHDLRQ